MSGRGRHWLPLVVAVSIGACGGPAAPASSGSGPAGSTGCRVELVADADGAVPFVRGEGFGADLPVELHLLTPGRDERLDESRDVGLRTDVRGVFVARPAFGPEDVGPVSLTVTSSGCSATAAGRIDAELFPPACITTPPAKTGSPIATAYRDLVLADDPIAYWRFEEAEGDVIGAEAGPEGIAAGRPTLAQAGVVEGSRSAGFDGTDDFVEFDGFVLDADFTIEAWVFPCGHEMNRDDAIIGVPRSGPDLNLADGRPRLFNGSVDVAIADQPIDAGRWVHVAVTRRGGDVVVFVDGVAAGSGRMDVPFPVAALGYGNADVYQGRMDEVAVYDQPLSPDRIAARVARTR